MKTTTLNRHNYPILGDAVGPYVHTSSFQNVLYTSGLTAFGGDAQQKNVQLQINDIFRQIRLITNHHKVGLQDIIKVTVYITDLSLLNEARDALMTIYNGHFPASSLVKVDALFHSDLLVEIEAVIALPALETQHS
ncbi:RidA family protein [Vibrio kyushuensis]|uniref:RidA family protein n=1 Tax=Vibrio kyushuensis TaxID=2910249 RepID=UPI003D0CDDEB